MAAYYANPANYRAIRAEVLAWHHTLRNSCVAFTATALWRTGAPLGPETQHQGLAASRLLVPFAAWLRATYDTEEVGMANLRAGDIVFAGAVGAVTKLRHVYVFIAWRDRRRRLARVVDNQGRLYVRPVLGDRRAYSPFAFALRLMRPRAEPRAE